jgi:hypothetical protein
VLPCQGIQRQNRRLAVIQKFKRIVGVGLWNRLARQETFSLLQGQARSLDMRGVMGFQDKCTVPHLPNPDFRQGSGLQKAPDSLN